MRIMHSILATALILQQVWVWLLILPTFAQSTDLETGAGNLTINMQVAPLPNNLLLAGL